MRDVQTLKEAFVRHIQYSLGRDEFSATRRDRFHALCLAVRDSLIERWINTQQTYYQRDARRVYYLSLEFLMGRALRNSLINLGLLETAEQAIKEIGYDLSVLEQQEVDAGLGNGGLGRLAACFLDSMATMQLPAYGYGLRYDYGIFRQEIRNGRQVEEPDDWLRLPNPWEIPRPDYEVRVQFGGRIKVYADEAGRLRHRWVDSYDVLATPYDTPIPGYRCNTVNTLRLWSAQGTAEFDLDDFNVGDYVGAVEHKVLAENITKVLYPADNLYAGKELRLRQQYLLVSATLQDVLRRHLVNHQDLDNLHTKVVFQLNDTHPALSVAEMMRLLVDVYGYEWEQAWQITSSCMAYTNHTLLPEALETWSVEMLGRLLPRHVDIINEINARFLGEVSRRFPDDREIVGRVSVYQEGEPKRVRMAHLAVIGSFSVNGVAQLHTDLLKTRVLPDFYRLWPDKFNNKTNGVTQRRWLLSCNAPLARLICDRIGDDWTTDLEQLRRLDQMLDDQQLVEQFGAVKLQAKQRLAEHTAKVHGFHFDPQSIVDIQIKRIHEYKRQLLNILHVVHLYLQLKRDPNYLQNPRTFIFGGKGAPGYAMAKLVIKLINDVAVGVNFDPQVSQRLKVFFYPNYGVSAGELLFPAADVSEQISTAGFEASGTGNMKFALNGAATLGTLDGANIEIAQAVGDENIFIFGLNVDQIQELRSKGYDPRKTYFADQNVRDVIDLIAGDFFNPEEPGIYQPIIDHLLDSDYYLVLADFESYRRTQLEIDRAYSDQRAFRRLGLANIARVGQFSSDRTIGEYAEQIWKVTACPVELK